MMDSSCEYDTCDTSSGHRHQFGPCRRRRERLSTVSHVSDISNKIDTLTNTLQDTTLNLNKVDLMLGQYREHTDGIGTMSESLEDCIYEQQKQCMWESKSGRSPSTCIRMDESITEGCASPLRHYTTLSTGCKERPMNVHFKDCTQAEQQIHSTNQSYRDLRSDHNHLGNDISNGFNRRNQKRTNNETRKTFKNISDQARASQRKEPMEDMHLQLLGMEQQHANLQEFSSLLSKQMTRQRQQETGSDNADLQIQFDRPGVSTSCEVGELKKTIAKKVKENAQLTFQVEALSANLEQREKQQLRLLSQLKEFQCHSEEIRSECRRLETQLMDDEKIRDKLHSKAQEVVNHWKAKYLKLKQELRVLKDESRVDSNEVKQSKKRESSLSQQAECVRRQLADTLELLAQREEDLRRCNVNLAEAQLQLASVKKELQEAQETLRCVEDKHQKQTTLQAQIKEENIRLHERIVFHEQKREEEQRSQSAERCDFTDRLSKLESKNKNLENQICTAQQENLSLVQQLEQERELHRKALSNLREVRQEDTMKQDRHIQDTLRLYKKDKEDLEGLVRDLKSEAVEDGALRGNMRMKLDKMKMECDKLMEQLSTRKESHAHLLLKYKALKKKVEGAEQKRQSAERSNTELLKMVKDRKIEQEYILHAVMDQIDFACQFLSQDSVSNLEAITFSSEQKDSHRWFAEAKMKLQWLCEEVRERDANIRETKLKHREDVKSTYSTSNLHQANEFVDP